MPHLTDRFVQLVPEGIRLKRQTSLFLVLALATLTRADAFNITNSPQYRNPEGRVTDAQFGEITTSYNERQVRFGLRVTF